MHFGRPGCAAGGLGKQGRAATWSRYAPANCQKQRQAARRAAAAGPRAEQRWRALQGAAGSCRLTWRRCCGLGRLRVHPRRRSGRAPAWGLKNSPRAGCCQARPLPPRARRQPFYWEGHGLPAPAAGAAGEQAMGPSAQLETASPCFGARQRLRKAMLAPRRLIKRSADASCTRGSCAPARQGGGEDERGLATLTRTLQPLSPRHPAGDSML